MPRKTRTTTGTTTRTASRPSKRRTTPAEAIAESEANQGADAGAAPGRRIASALDQARQAGAGKPAGEAETQASQPTGGYHITPTYGRRLTNSQKAEQQLQSLEEEVARLTPEDRQRFQGQVKAIRKAAAQPTLDLEIAPPAGDSNTKEQEVADLF